MRMQWPVAQAAMYTYAEPPRAASPAPPAPPEMSPQSPESTPVPPPPVPRQPPQSLGDGAEGVLATRGSPVHIAASKTANATAAAAAEGCTLDDDVREILDRLNFGCYAEAFRANGFDNIVSLVGMRRDHMEKLGMLPGHVVKLEFALMQIRARHGLVPPGSPHLGADARGGDSDLQPATLAAWAYGAGSAMAAIAAAVPTRLRSGSNQAALTAPETAKKSALVSFCEGIDIPSCKAVSERSDMSQCQSLQGTADLSRLMKEVDTNSSTGQDSRCGEHANDASAARAKTTSPEVEILVPEYSDGQQQQQEQQQYHQQQLQYQQQQQQQKQPPAPQEPQPPTTMPQMGIPTLPPQVTLPAASAVDRFMVNGSQGSRNGSAAIPPTAGTACHDPGPHIRATSSGTPLPGVSPTGSRVVVVSKQGSRNLPTDGLATAGSPSVRRVGGSTPSRTVVTTPRGDERPGKYSDGGLSTTLRRPLSGTTVHVPPSIEVPETPTPFGSSVMRMTWGQDGTARASPTESTLTSSSCTVSASTWVMQRDRLLAAKQQQKQLAQAVKTMTGSIQTDKQLTQWLRSHGVFNVNSEKKGMLRTSYPLHVAVEENDPNMIRLLIIAGAHTKRTDSSGRTALQLAERRNKKGSHDQVIEILKNAHTLRPKPGPSSSSGSGSSDLPSREPSVASAQVGP